MVKDLYLDFDRPEVITKELNEREARTTDMSALRKEAEEHLVFVYGTLKMGLHNSGFLRKARYLGKGYTTKEGFQMYDTGSFPVVRDVDKGHHRVYGEIYAVTSDNMLSLDYLEGNGFLYERQRQLITFMDQLVEGRRVIRYCWIYLGMEKAFDGFVDMTPMKVDQSIEPNGLIWKGISP